jgi:hypothetical protein
MAAAALMTAAFQNCGSPQHEKASPSERKPDFFEYPFSAKPEFYGEIVLLKPAAALENLAEFTFFGAVTSTGEPEALSYEVRIKDAGGRALCPMQSGNLAKGETSIRFDCVTALNADEANVEIKVTSATKTAVFTKTYR